MHEFFFENLRNPARIRRAGVMRQFPTNQVYSTSTRRGAKVDSECFKSSNLLLVDVLNFVPVYDGFFYKTGYFKTAIYY
jgi:hypothetical protein